MFYRYIFIFDSERWIDFHMVEKIELEPELLIGSKVGAIFKNEQDSGIKDEIIKQVLVWSSANDDLQDMAMMPKGMH